MNKISNAISLTEMWIWVANSRRATAKKWCS